MAKIEDQVSWNLSQRISDEIYALIQTCRRAALNGDFLKCFHVSREIRLVINYHFDTDEIKKVDELEQEINDISIEIKTLALGDEEGGQDDFEYDYTNRNRNNNARTNLIVTKNKRFLLVMKYRKLVFQLLDEYGYLMERKKDASYMM